jgi:hypothetical protein
MNYKTFSLPLLALLSAIFLVGFASAAVLEISGVSYSSTASHNSDVSVTFSVAYSGADSSASINFSGSTTNIGTWKTLPSIEVVENDSVAHSLSAVLNIPAHASGTVTATLLADSLNTTASDTETLTITITSAPALEITSKTDLTKTQNGTINITNTGNAALSDIHLSASGDFNVSFSSNDISLSAGASTTVNVNALDSLDDLDLGPHTVSILASDSSAHANDTFDYTLYGDFCSDGEINASKVGITDINDNSDVSDEWSWKPLDDIEIEVEIENNVGDDEDFVVELALYDTEDHEYVELDGDDTLQQDISIDEDDSDKVTFNFQLPAEVEDSNGRYVLYIKAYVDGDEDRYCNSEAAEDISSSANGIEINKKSNDVVLDDISAPELVTAGETVVVHATAFNIGTKDEDKVAVGLSNSKLGLDLESAPSGIDAGESDDVEFTFVVPYTAQNGVYTLRLITYFDYKKSSDTYSKDSDAFDVKMNVVGGVDNKTTTTAQSAGASDISASLESDAKAGESMDVSVTIKNLGKNKTTFVVGVSGYDSWAELSSISERVLTLNAGESKDITVSFNVNKDASGEKTFTVESRAGDKIDTKQVAVEFTSDSWFSKLKASLGKSSIIWIIGLVNLVLIILIIYLAVRIFRR